MPQPGSTVLLATNHLASFAGSEIIILELAEFLAARGCQVTVFANYISESLAAEPILQRISVASTPPALCDFDFAWVQHQLLPRLTEQPPAPGDVWPALVFAHLSPYEPMETPFVELENATASLIVANSPETAAALTAMGIADAKLAVFPNPAPRSFHRSSAPHQERLSKLLIVSHHAPTEVLEAADILRTAHGITVDLYGVGGRAARITPDVIQSYDAVATIGKTVQYCIESRVPVFCYDHFGGPGWLTPDNFDLAAQYNFSGRCTGSTRTAAALVQEICDGFAAAQNAATSLAGRIPTLEDWFAAMEDRLAVRPVITTSPQQPWRQYRQLADLIARESSGRFRGLDEARVLTAIVAAKEQELISLQQHVRAFHDAHVAQVESLEGVLSARDRELASLKHINDARDEELASVKTVLAARDEELSSVKPVLAARDEELSSVKAVLAARDEELANLKAHLAALKTQP